MSRPRMSMPARGEDKENVDVRRVRKSVSALDTYVPPVTSPVRAQRKVRHCLQPRKSAIRAVPQVFESPATLGPNPEHRHVNITAPAADIVAMVERTTRQELAGLGLPTSPGLPNPFVRRAASMTPSRDAHTIALPAQSSPPSRKRRRVTFSAQDVKTDFVQDEPTMHIRPAFIESPRLATPRQATPRQAMPRQATPRQATPRQATPRQATPRQATPTRTESDLSYASGSSSDMSMDTTAASIPAENASVASDGSEMQFTDAYEPPASDTSDMQLTTAWRPPRESTGEVSTASAPMDMSQSLDMDLTGASVLDDVDIEHENAVHESFAHASEESAMEMTQAWGHVEASRRQSTSTALPRAVPAARKSTGGDTRTHSVPTRKSTSPVAHTQAPASSPARQHRSPSPSPPSPTRSASPRRAASPSPQSPRSPRSPDRVGHRTCLESPRSPHTPRVHSPVRIVRSNSNTPIPRPASPQSHLLSPKAPTSPRMPGSPSTPRGSPSRFRQSLRGGVPSPSYEHSPPRRERTPPPATPRGRPSGTPLRPRSPFISSIMRQRNYTDLAADDDDVSLDDTSFHMPLADFLAVIGLKFHEDMTASRQRPVLPLELESSAARRQNRESVSLVSHAKIAAGAAPMLQTLRDACAELRQHVEDGRERLRLVEDTFYARPPAFVQEWGQLEDEEMRRSMKGQLNVHKQAARAAAMHDYYGWRTDTQFDDELVMRLTQHRAVLERSATHVDEANSALGKELPTLRARHAELSRRVATARQRHAAIEACDKNELRQLHASIEEQEHELQAMRSRCGDAEDQLARVRARIDEAAEKRGSIEEAIRAARAVCDQIRGCSPGEAMRLQRRIVHIERLFQWHLESSTATLLQFTHAGALHVAIELEGRARAVRRVVVSPAGPVEASPLYVAAMALVRGHLKKHTPPDVPGVLQAVSARWLACRRLRAEIDHLKAHTPVHLVADKQSDLSIALVAPLLFVRRKAKANVRIELDLADAEPFKHVDVEVLYGEVDSSAIAQDIQGALVPNTRGALTSAVLDTRDAYDL